MTIKRLATATTVAVLLVASPSSGLAFAPPSQICRANFRIRTKNANSRPDSSAIVGTTTTRYMAVSVADMTGDYQSSSQDSPGWHRRVLRKVFRRRRNKPLLEMQGVAVLDETTLDRNAALQIPLPFNVGSQQDPLSVSLGNLEALLKKPLHIHVEGLPIVEPTDGIKVTTATLGTREITLEALDDQVATSSSLTNEFSLVVPQEVVATMEDVGTIMDTSYEIDSRSRFGRITRPWVQNILMNLFDRWSKGSHVNLQINCDPQSRTFDLVQGRFACDASADFDRIVFGPIRMHKGRLEVHRMNLGLWSLTPDLVPIRGQRYLNQFDFYGRNITFTEEDLIDSRCIRNGLRNLLTRILKLRGTNAVQITVSSIEILPSGKISCQGEATNVFGKILAFEVRSRLDFASRGHILNFPGLEISLNPRLGLFVPVLPAISLDLGHNAQLLDLNIDGDNAQMQVSARVTIAPHHTLKLQKYSQSQDAYLAQYSVDVGRWLTNLGNFTS